MNRDLYVALLYPSMPMSFVITPPPYVSMFGAFFTFIRLNEFSN